MISAWTCLNVYLIFCLLIFSVIAIETEAEEIPDVPEKLEPFLKNTLTDKDSHVRMAAAVCYYAIGKQNEVAQDIMKNALIHG